MSIDIEKETQAAVATTLEYEEITAAEDEMLSEENESNDTYGIFLFYLAICKDSIRSSGHRAVLFAESCEEAK